MKKLPAKVKYLNMGPWPGFVALCFSNEVFHAEMRRLKIKNPGDYLSGPYAAATHHHFTSESGRCVYMIAFGPVAGRSREQMAGLAAHEAVHVMQSMQEDLANGKSLGREAEAYLVQMIVQEALQCLWKSERVRSIKP